MSILQQRAVTTRSPAMVRRPVEVKPKTVLMERIELKDAGADKKKLWLLIGSCATIALAAGLIMWQVFFRPNDVMAESHFRTAIDAETGEVVSGFRVQEGESFPWTHPKTGKASLYPAEECFWNADGTAKLKPTYVLLNSYAGKTGKTSCPDCGREVVPHNPMPPDELMIQAAQREGH